MKTFEHEVLTFDANDKKGFAEMQKTLAEWGQSGFEVVSVIGTAVNASYFTVFLKRQQTTVEEHQSEDEQ